MVSLVIKVSKARMVWVESCLNEKTFSSDKFMGGPSE